MKNNYKRNKLARYNKRSLHKKTAREKVNTLIKVSQALNNVMYLRKKTNSEKVTALVKLSCALNNVAQLSKQASPCDFNNDVNNAYLLYKMLNKYEY